MSALAVFALCAVVLGACIVETDDVDAAADLGTYNSITGSSSRNDSSYDKGYSKLWATIDDFTRQGVFRVLVGADIWITGGSIAPNGPTYVSSGFGLSLNSGDVSDIDGKITKKGTITIEYVDSRGGGPYQVQMEAIEPDPQTTPVTSITINGTTYVDVGKTITLTATTSPSGATDRHVTWSITSGSSRVTYTTTDTSTGGTIKITGKSAGSVTVRATAADGSGVYATKTITVEEPEYYYYLNYDANGGTNTPSRTEGIANNTTSTLNLKVTNSEPTRSGYTFLGWSKSSTATVATYHAGDTVGVTYDDLTLYAVWQKNPVTYSLSFNANGGSGAPGALTGTTTGSSYTFTIPSDTPYRSGYTFLGWSTSNTATTATYKSGDTFTASSTSNTLYAVWKLTEYTSTLNFSASGAENIPAPLTFTGTSTSDHEFTIPSTVPTKTGYVFIGWSETNGSTTAQYSAGGKVSVGYDSSKTLYAVWQAATLDITSLPSLSVIVNQPWTYNVTTNISGCTVTISGADWLTVSGTTISGTPTTAGTYHITVTVSKDGGYVNGVQTFDLTVYSAIGFISQPSASGVYAYVG